MIDVRQHWISQQKITFLILYFPHYKMTVNNDLGPGEYNYILRREFSGGVIVHRVICE